jgi:O-antigen/teichoic acid export membrane protein
MIRRLSIVAGFTGLSHLAAIAALSLVSGHVGPEVIGTVGIIEATFLFLVTVISFGLQLSSTRYIAISEDWSGRYRAAQTARLALSLGIVGGAALAYACTRDARYLLYGGAPAIALNGDYALYGRGKAEYAAAVSFLRGLMPAAVLAVAGIWYPHYLLVAYALAFAAGYLCAGLLAAAGLGVPYFYPPRPSALKEYLLNVTIGIAAVAMFLMTTGIIYVARHVYEEAELGLFYVALKVYVIYRGVRRIIVQSFFRDLIDDAVALKVDQLAFLAGMPFFIVTVMYPEALIRTLFDPAYLSARLHFVLLGMTVLVASIATSASTKILLNQDDRRYLLNVGTACAVTMATCIAFSFVPRHNGYGLGMSMLLGEFVLLVLNARAMKIRSFLYDRARFMAVPAVLLLLPLYLRYRLGDSFVALVVSVAAFGLPAAGLYYRRFSRVVARNR